jgi:predicted DNA binding CopG/RHH family protein
MKKIPLFKNEDQEQKFWSSHDSTGYINWNSAERVPFSNLKPSLKTISLRLPETMLESLKTVANKRDIPYQSLLKIFLAERLKDEMSLPKSKTSAGTSGQRRKRMMTPR